MPEQVNSVTPPQQPTATVATKKELNWKRILLGIVIGVILVGIAAITFWYFTRPKESTTTTKTSTPSAKTATPSASVDETAGWKTFQGEGFSIKYPPSWGTSSTTDSSKNPVYYFTGRDRVARYFGISIATTSFSGNFADWCAKDPACDGNLISYPPYHSGIKENNMNGMDVYQFIDTDEKGANTPAAGNYIPRGSTLYCVGWSVTALDLNYKFSDLVKEFNDPIFEQIFSTFKFL